MTLLFVLGHFIFNENHIKILIDKLNICKAARPDGIHAKVIKECSCMFSYDIFNTIFHINVMEGKIPQQWKESNVRALYNNKNEANLCAPITAQSVLPPLYVIT